jgi:O-methyltransferase domain
VYWIRRCLHNYGDHVSVNILKKVVEAMADDSKVVIQEDVMDNPPSNSAAMLDIMMLGFGGKQRTLETWQKVISAAGLQISSVAKGNGPWKSLCVIECVKASA